MLHSASGKKGEGLSPTHLHLPPMSLSLIWSLSQGSYSEVEGRKGSGSLGCMSLGWGKFFPDGPGWTGGGQDTKLSTYQHSSSLLFQKGEVKAS